MCHISFAPQAHAVLPKVGYPEFILNNTYINEDIRQVTAFPSAVLIFFPWTCHMTSAALLLTLVSPSCAVIVFREGLFWECDADIAFHLAVRHRLAQNYGSTHRVGSLTII